MFRPNFSVVTGVLVALCVLGLIASLLKPLLPPAATNQLTFSDQDFLRRAAHQAIDWQELTPEAIDRATVQNKPILLVIGVVSSGLGQRLDTTAFLDDDIARYINRNFAPIRVDGLEHPEWINAYFPVSRLKLEFLPGTQIWVLTTKGEIVEFIGRTSVDQTFDLNAMYRLLRGAYSKFIRVRDGHERLTANLVQRNDITQLASQSGSVVPPFLSFRATLESAVDLKYGGLPLGGLQQLFPNAWRYMCLTGDLALLRDSLNPVLKSPMMDLMDGGFFRVSTAADYQQVEFNKVASEQAEMLLTLSIAWRLTQDDLYFYAAQNTYRALSQTMMAGSWVAAFKIEEPPEQKRSESYSFSVAKLRNSLSGPQRRWARDNLGLDVLTNKQMVPYLAQDRAIGSAELENVLTLLRANRGGKASLSGIGFLEIEATVAARVLQAGRLLSERSWVKYGEDRLRNLEIFVKPSGLLRNASSNRLDPGYLGDYLAYSDAMLQAYLATGSEAHLDNGLKILLSVPERFDGLRDGEYRLSEKEPIFSNTNLPEIADNFRESCSARALRLFLAYGRLFGDRAEGKRLLRLSYDVANQFGLIAGEGGPSAGAFFCAAAELTDGMYAVTVGPSAIPLSMALVKAVPTRLVFPAVGKVRPDLQQRAPGIYIVDDGATGPYTLEEARERFPAMLSLPNEP